MAYLTPSVQTGTLRTMSELTTFRDVIDCWPSLGAFASDVGLSYEAAKQMRRRDSISGRHFINVAHAAAHRGIRGASVPDLAAIAAQRSEPAE